MKTSKKQSIRETLRSKIQESQFDPNAITATGEFGVSMFQWFVSARGEEHTAFGRFVSPETAKALVASRKAIVLHGSMIAETP